MEIFEVRYANEKIWCLGVKLTQKDALNLKNRFMETNFREYKYIILVDDAARRVNKIYNFIIQHNEKFMIERVKDIIEKALN